MDDESSVSVGDSRRVPAMLCSKKVRGCSRVPLHQAASTKKRAAAQGERTGVHRGPLFFSSRVRVYNCAGYAGYAEYAQTCTKPELHILPQERTGDSPGWPSKDLTRPRALGFRAEYEVHPPAKLFQRETARKRRALGEAGASPQRKRLKLMHRPIWAV